MAVVDLREFPIPVRVEYLCRAIGGEVVACKDKYVKEVNGYTVIDSRKAVEAYSGSEYAQLFGATTERALVFTNVEAGCLPMMIVRVSSLKPRIVVFHKTQPDAEAIRIAGGTPAASKASGRLTKSLLLNAVFTDPQLATIGRSESQLQILGQRHLSASYPFNDHGKSILMEANDGYVKVIAEPRRGRILGAEIVGWDAAELIHCFSGPLAMRATIFDLLRAPWYHPTLAEIITYPLEEIAAQVRRS